jgi:Amt family ammonium transporter
MRLSTVTLRRLFSLACTAALTLLPAVVLAEDAPYPEFATQASANTVWLMTAAAMVFLMQAGFAFLESGMSRSKNAVNILMKNVMDCCVGSLLFWAVGYGLMFGVNTSGVFGESHFMPAQMDAWGYSFLLFQMMFAATAATIASGAMAERTRFGGYLVGAAIITAVIYPVSGSWIWGGFHGGKGWLAELGFIDFAGSTVVHSVGAWCALAGIIVVGPRLGRYPRNEKPRTLHGHNLNLVALGGFILWFGWFGFNGGSTAAANVDIGLINLNTQLAACAGAIGAVLGCRLTGQPMLLTAIINGILGGLVAITAGCATTTPDWAILTGFVAGIFAIVGMKLMDALRLDDVVGAVSVHGFCGAWGTLAAGLFFAADPFNADRVIVQMIGIGACFLWAFLSALLMYGLIALFFGLRAPPLDEQRGLDISEHAEIGYPEFSRQNAYDTDTVERITR